MRSGTGLPGIQLAPFARLRATSGAQDCLDQFIGDAIAHLQRIPHAEIVPLPEKEEWSISHRLIQHENTGAVQESIIPIPVLSLAERPYYPVIPQLFDCGAKCFAILAIRVSAIQ
jgi:hypothetical protein